MQKISYICAKGHVFRTRTHLLGRLWMGRHNKCFKEVYTGEE